MDVYLFLGCLLVSIFCFWLISLRRRKPGLPPGSLGLPLVGETLQLISAYKTEDPEPFIDDRVGRYGRIFVTHVFGEPTVFITDAESNRFVLQNEGRLFECSYPSSISNLLGRHSLLLMKGGLHKKMHSLTMSFANSSIIRDHLLVDIDRLVGYNVNGWEGKSIRLLDETKKITFELTVKQLMSIDPGEWTERLRKEYLLLIEGFFSIPLPLFFTTYGRALKARGKVAETLRSMVRQRRKELVEGGEGKKDMLAALMDSEEGFSEEEMVDFLLALLVAGYETTSTIMTLAIKFLTETPLALSQLKKEHEGIRAKKTKDGMALDWSDYKSMIFTQCVINETLRVANIISGVFRRAISDVHIKGGYIIPKGWRVFASFRAVHLDHSHYPNARTFDPWRWQSNSPPSGGVNIYTPFGGGPRLCPGYELARVEISIFLHHLVTDFCWEAAEDDKLVFFPTTRMAKRYPIQVHRRKTA